MGLKAARGQKVVTVADLDAHHGRFHGVDDHDRPAEQGDNLQVRVRGAVRGVDGVARVQRNVDDGGGRGQEVRQHDEAQGAGHSTENAPRVLTGVLAIFPRPGLANPTSAVNNYTKGCVGM